MASQMNKTCDDRLSGIMPEHAWGPLADKHVGKTCSRVCPTCFFRAQLLSLIRACPFALALLIRFLLTCWFVSPTGIHFFKQKKLRGCASCNCGIHGDMMSGVAHGVTVLMNGKPIRRFRKVLRRGSGATPWVSCCSEGHSWVFSRDPFSCPEGKWT